MQAFLTIAVIHILGAMSPGPDFILITKNTLSLSRKSGVYTALGLAFGVLFHTAYCLLGIGLIISQSILLFQIIKYLGAAYLLYIGWNALTHKRGTVNNEAGNVTKATDDLSPLAAVRMGFLCNVLNPKATLFFLAMFTQVIDPATSLGVRIFYGTYMGVATFVWFAFVANFLSIGLIKRQFEKIQGAFTRVMGAALMALGLKVALSSRE